MESKVFQEDCISTPTNTVSTNHTYKNGPTNEGLLHSPQSQ